MMFLKRCISLSHMIYDQLRQLGHTLLPYCCVLCGDLARPFYNLCESCQQSLPSLPYCCQQCARFLPLESAKDSKLYCGSCLHTPPAYHLTHALFPYQSPITEMITALKFQHQLIYAKTLGQLLSEKIERVWYRDKALPDLIIPVPLHPKRLAERGFNQALELAKPLASALRLPILKASIKRIKHTAAQSGLSAKTRQQNITRAFSSNHSYEGLTVALLDDVITTGHTMKELSKVIKKNGAKSIHVWCVARNG